MDVQAIRHAGHFTLEHSLLIMDGVHLTFAMALSLIHIVFLRGPLSALFPSVMCLCLSTTAIKEEEACATRGVPESRRQISNLLSVCHIVTYN